MTPYQETQSAWDVRQGMVKCDGIVVVLGALNLLLTFAKYYFRSTGNTRKSYVIGCETQHRATLHVTEGEGRHAAPIGVLTTPSGVLRIETIEKFIRETCCRHSTSPLCDTPKYSKRDMIQRKNQ